MLNKLTDERLTELYTQEKSKQSPDRQILFSIASEQRYRNRDTIVEDAKTAQKKTIQDIGNTMKRNKELAEANKALFIPVEKL